MRLLLLILLSFLSLGLTAQVPLRSIPAYDFIDIDQTYLVFPGDSSSFIRFFKKLDRLSFEGKGKLNIYHIGGSHVQAGSFTHRLRENLGSMIPGLNSGYGFAFPFAAAKTNNPLGFETRCNGSWTTHRNILSKSSEALGLMGIAITTSDANAGFSINTQTATGRFDDLRHAFDRVTLLGRISGAIPIATAGGKNYVGNFDEELEAWTFELDSLHNEVSFSLEMTGTAAPKWVVRGTHLGSSRPGITVHGIGVNGASVPAYLRCEYLQQELTLAPPDLVIFAIGVNDAVGNRFSKLHFKNNYYELIRQFRKVSPDCSFLFVTNNDFYGKVRGVPQVNKNGLAVEEAFYELAERYQGGVWNLYDFMGREGSVDTWLYEKLAQDDRIHFSREGYELLGDLLYNAILNKYVQYLSITGDK